MNVHMYLSILVFHYQSYTHVQTTVVDLRMAFVCVHLKTK